MELLTKNKVKLVKTLQKFVSDDSTRSFMCDFYCDEEAKKLIGTDGKSMMVLDADKIVVDLKGGYYDLRRDQLVPIDLDSKFPLWRKVMPDYTASDYKAYSIDIQKEPLLLIRELMKLAKFIDLWLSFDLVKRIPEGAYIMYVNDDRRKAAVFVPRTDRSIEYVIMPMSAPEENDFPTEYKEA